MARSDHESRPGAPQHVHDALANGRLVLILDALLATRSVTRAAELLGMHASGVSRILGELREKLDDPLLIRSGRRLVPSPFAETLRPKLRSIAADIHAVFERGEAEPGRTESIDDFREASPGVSAEPRTPRSADPGVMSPPLKISTKRDAGGRKAHQAAKAIIHAIGIVGAGSGLKGDEAEAAFAASLRSEAKADEVGSLFGVIQSRGVTATELTGFVRAARADVEAQLGEIAGIRADLDWPCYVTSNYHKPPWFFHAALLVAQAGHRVVLHGGSIADAVSNLHLAIADALDIPVCIESSQVSLALSHRNIAYIPMIKVSPRIFGLLGVSGPTASYSLIHEVIQLLQPIPTAASMLGLVKASYKGIHRDAAELLGIRNLSVFTSARDVAQLAPFRLTTIYRLVNGEPMDLSLSSRPVPPAGPRPSISGIDFWHAVWSGAVRSQRAEAIITATAAVALLTLSGSAATRLEYMWALAEELWRTRHARN